MPNTSTMMTMLHIYWVVSFHERLYKQLSLASTTFIDGSFSIIGWMVFVSINSGIQFDISHQFGALKLLKLFLSGYFPFISMQYWQNNGLFLDFIPNGALLNCPFFISNIIDATKRWSHIYRILEYFLFKKKLSCILHVKYWWFYFFSVATDQKAMKEI